MDKIQQEILRVISIELECLKELSSCIDNHYTKVVQLLYKSKGKVIWIGMGKSGHIAKKIASTMSSTGTPCLFFASYRGLPRRFGNSEFKRYCYFYQGTPISRFTSIEGNFKKGI